MNTSNVHSTTRRRVATTVFLAAALSAGAATSGAQPAPHVPTGVFSARLAFAVSDPKGDFGKNTGNGYGIDVSGLARLDKQSIINARLDLSFLSYASSTRRIPLVGSGNLVKLDLETSSSIFTMVGGPQLLGPTGVFRPYVSALGGFSYFSTNTSVQGSDDEEDDFASTTNSSDAALAYGGSAGAYVRVYQTPTRDVRLEFGARYLRHDNAKYLNDKQVEEGFQNNRDPIPLRGRADFVTYYIGINAILW
ncbi:MAG: hypothetical protein H7Z40_13070 [Phycisphaerae bacterium]|nr:hypothetical protein [Gemmatimonadaceae bacterium]